MSGRTDSLYFQAELIQTALGLIYLLGTLYTLEDAVATYHRVKSVGPMENLWAWISVRGKGCLSFVQLISLAMGSDRLGLLMTGYEPPLYYRWTAFGLMRTTMATLCFITAWTNMRAFRQLRDASGSSGGVDLVNGDEQTQ